MKAVQIFIRDNLDKMMIYFTQWVANEFAVALRDNTNK